MTLLSNNSPKKSTFRFRPLLWINYVFIILLLFTQLTPIIAPDTLWPMTILALAFPLLLLINGLFVILWLITLKKYLFYSLLAIIFSYSLTLDHFQFRSSTPKVEDKEAITLFSFNAKNLSNNNFNRADKKIRMQIMSFTADKSADIVCFQEFQSYPTKGIHTVKEFKNQLGMKNSYAMPYLKKSKLKYIDLLVLYTNYNIKNSKDFYMDGKAYGFYVDLEVKGKTIRVFNLHLESNHFNTYDYQIFTEKEANLNSEKGHHIVWLLKKIKKYSVKRTHQARTIKEAIKQSPFPVIVLGDFNDTPASFIYQHISENMTDAFKIKGNGYGNTYNGELPPMRIDYALFKGDFEILNYQVLKPNLSDHYPLLIKFKLK
ncbi:MAG: hypothetical protein B7C24_01855 [Bacteroidetes bacterium 4572_77]|nr:MAG: hypothetical protein B7C24_01855 [Bacteroidetes bacterium 4572_77]